MRDSANLPPFTGGMRGVLRKSWLSRFSLNSGRNHDKTGMLRVACRVKKYSAEILRKFSCDQMLLEALKKNLTESEESEEAKSSYA